MKGEQGKSRSVQQQVQEDPVMKELFGLCGICSLSAVRESVFSSTPSLFLEHTACPSGPKGSLTGSACHPQAQSP